jgi:hypothetical protein
MCDIPLFSCYSVIDEGVGVPASDIMELATESDALSITFVLVKIDESNQVEGYQQGAERYKVVWQIAGYLLFLFFSCPDITILYHFPL